MNIVLISAGSAYVVVGQCGLAVCAPLLQPIVWDWFPVWWKRIFSFSHTLAFSPISFLSFWQSAWKEFWVALHYGFKKKTLEITRKKAHPPPPQTFDLTKKNQRNWSSSKRHYENEYNESKLIDRYVFMIFFFQIMIYVITQINKHKKLNIYV